MTLAQADIATEQTTDPAKVAHYVKKQRITEAVIEGTAVEALCGHVWVPSRDPQNFPVCQGCQAVYDDNEAIILAGRSM